MIRPTRPYRALRAGVGTVIIVTVVALWAQAQLTGERMSSLWEFVVLMLVVASGIAVFGRRTVEAAVETSQKLRDDDSDSDSTADADGEEPSPADTDDG